MDDKTGNRSAKHSGVNDIKMALWPYLKYFSLLATIAVTPIIASIPGFEYWHLTPILGGGGLATIIVWQRTRGTTVRSEMEVALERENMRMRYTLFGQLIVLLFVVVLVGGMLMLFLLSSRPDVLDKIFDFVLELVKG